MRRLGWAIVVLAAVATLGVDARGEQTASDAGSPTERAAHEFNAAIAARGTGDRQAAKQSLERAVRIASECECVQLKGDIGNALAVVALEEGNAIRAVDIVDNVDIASNLSPATRVNLLNTKAEALASLGRNEEAIAEFWRALNIDPRVDANLTVTLVENLSVALQRSGRADEAVDLLTQHMHLPTANAGAIRFRLGLRLGLVLFNAKRLHEARSKFSDLADQALLAGRPDVAIFSLRELSATVEAQGDLQKAVEVLTKARALSNQGGQQVFAADLAHQIAVLLVKLGRYEAARDAYEDALKGYASAGQRRGVFRSQVGLGTLAGRVGSYALASALLTKALKDAPDTDSAEVISARNSLANVYTLMNRFDDARIIYTELLNVLTAPRTSNTSMLGSVLVNLAVCYSRLHQPAEVHRYLEAAQRREVADAGQRAVLLNNLALAYDAIGDQAGAVRLMQQSVELRKGLSNPVFLAEGYANMAAVIGDTKYGVKADFNGAQKALKTALRIIEAQNLPRQKALYLGNLGATLRNLKQFQEAEKALLAAKRALETLGDETAEIAVLGNLGETYVAQKRYRDAISPYQTAISLIERVRLDASDDTSRISLFERQKNYFATLIDLYSETGMGQEAFAVVERGRSRALLDLLRDQHIITNTPQAAALRARVLELQDRRLVLQRKLLAEEGGSLATLRARDAVTGELLQAMRTLSESSPVSDRAGLDVVSLYKLQKRTLRQGEVYVSFKLNAHRLHVFVVSPTSFRMLSRKIEAADLRSQVARFIHAIQERRPVQQQGHELYKLLLEPIEASLEGAKRVFLTGDDVLLMLPFEALSRGSGNDQKNFLLFSSYELVNVPSASVLMAIRRKGPSGHASQHPIFLIGAPAYTPGATYSDYRWMRDCADRTIGNLREAEGEIVAIAAAFGLKGEDEAVHIGHKATISRLRAAPLERYRFIQIVVHGVVCGFGRGSWEEPALAFAAEEARTSDPAATKAPHALLYASDIYQLRVNAELVTLSACESAAGESVNGEGVIGFARAFLAIGARAVNASLWLVNDAAASVQMSRFYSMIAEGSVTSTAAWKKVRQEFVINPPKENQSHPFFWAAFVMYGDPP